MANKISSAFFKSTQKSSWQLRPNSLNTHAKMINHLKKSPIGQNMTILGLYYSINRLILYCNITFHSEYITNLKRGVTLFDRIKG